MKFRYRLLNVWLFFVYSEKCEWCEKTYRQFYWWHDIEEHRYQQNESDIYWEMWSGA